MPNTREKEELIESLEKSLIHDGSGREMRFVGGDVVPAVLSAIANGVKKVSQDWSDRVKDTVYQNIQRRMYMNGEFPAAIIACGECQYVFMDNPREVQLTTDGMTLWRGVPLIRCGGKSQVIVAWNMEEIKLPEPPKGE